MKTMRIIRGSTQELQTIYRMKNEPIISTGGSSTPNPRPKMTERYREAIELYRSPRLSCREISRTCSVSLSGLKGPYLQISPAPYAGAIRYFMRQGGGRNYPARPASKAAACLPCRIQGGVRGVQQHGLHRIQRLADRPPLRAGWHESRQTTPDALPRCGRTIRRGAQAAGAER